MVVQVYLKDGELNLKEGWEVLEVESKEEADSLLRLVDMRGYMGIWKVPRALRGSGRYLGLYGEDTSSKR
jgi:hypothetical protein